MYVGKIPNLKKSSAKNVSFFRCYVFGFVSKIVQLKWTCGIMLKTTTVFFCKNLKFFENLNYENSGKQKSFECSYRI